MTEIIEHEGKQYRRVQIEGTDGDHLMDDDANIYTLDFVKIGCAGDSDNDEDIWIWIGWLLTYSDVWLPI